MKRFASLILQLEETTKTARKTQALAQYMSIAPEQDRLWCLALFSGRRPKRTVATSQLREWAADTADLPLWLLEETYSVVGDLAETIALILPEGDNNTDRSLSEWIDDLRRLTKCKIIEKKAFILNSWSVLSGQERFVFNKLITGGFRVGVSQKLMTRAVAQATSKPEVEIAHRLMGNWTPDQTDWYALIEAEDFTSDLSRPYPFFLSHALEDAPHELGTPSEWSAEWKWDGIRGQLILRGGECFVWSRGEELVSNRFPELQQFSGEIPDGTVIDGEILAWQNESPLSFNLLQKRISRKTVPKALLQSAPVILYAYDILEWQGKDVRDQPFQHRRALLEDLCANTPLALPLRLSPSVFFQDWCELTDLRATSRDQRAEGLMLKNLSSPYLVGRRKGHWWKWKLDPLIIDAVMIYAQAGHGRRANLYTDFTFAVWDGNDLVPFTKAYSGLTDAEFRQISAWVRKNTLQRFGPVRQVTPHHVFEIAFEGIHESPRHKSGVALRFPRMARWRQDKTAQDANSLDDLKDMLKNYG